MRGEAELRKQLAWALGMWGKYAHPYDAGYADALAWVLGEPAPTRMKEGLPTAEGRPGSARTGVYGSKSSKKPDEAPESGARLCT